MKRKFPFFAAISLILLAGGAAAQDVVVPRYKICAKLNEVLNEIMQRRSLRCSGAVLLGGGEIRCADPATGRILWFIVNDDLLATPFELRVERHYYYPEVDPREQTLLLYRPLMRPLAASDPNPSYLLSPARIQDEELTQAFQPVPAVWPREKQDKALEAMRQGLRYIQLLWRGTGTDAKSARFDGSRRGR